MKKIIAILLTVAMLVTSVSVTFPIAKEVQAAETNTATETTNSEGANLDMIKLKMQALAEPYAYKDSRATKLRIVASVDSLDYAAVGFKVWYNADITNGANGGLNATPTATVRTGTVYERIEAANDGVAYEYSPKVVDTSSEYFVTATLVNIAEKNWDKNFYIKAYCITLDGQTVEGEGRFVNINKGTSNEYINLPIEMTEEQYNSMTTVTVAGTTYQFGTNAEKAYYDGKSGHIYVNVGDKTALKSASLVQAGTGANAPSEIYRNLNSTYTVDGSGNTAGDSSWYDESQNEFIIANEADLYGLASIYTTNTGSAMNIFAGKTFYLVKDMKMNEVVNGEFQTKTLWKGIGKYIPSHVINFAGNFDGQGHTISGIYRYQDATEVSNSNVYAGFFNRVQAGAQIKGFTLENSYFEGANATGGEYIGAIAGYEVGASYENISVKETVTVKGCLNNAGGFVGQTSTTTKISFKNCEFKGTVSAPKQVGGFIGMAPTTGKIYFENCFAGGSVSATLSNTQANTASGFCGKVSSPVIFMENCVSVSTVKRKDNASVGFVGSAGGGSISYNNAYTTAASRTAVSVDDSSKKITATARGNTSIKSNYKASDFQGENAFINTALDFKNVWTVVEGDYPQLRLFADVVQDEPQINRLHLTNGDSSWLALYDGTKENPYILKDAEDLYGLAKLSKGTDIIDSDKDGNLDTFAGKLFDGKYFVLANDIAVNYDNDNETNRLTWPAIGGQLDSTVAFKGSFDGQGHTISGIYFNSATGENAGLFACVANSSAGANVIGNFTIENSSYLGLKQIGAVAGVAYGGNYPNIRVADDVTIKGTRVIGGIIGRALPVGEISLEQCSFEGNVEATATADGGYAGGLIGWLYRSSNPSPAYVSNCLVKGTIKNGHTYSGGVCGYVQKSHKIIVENTLSVSEYTTGSYTGGVVGMNAGEKAAGTTETIMKNVYTTNKNSLGYGGSKVSSAKSGLAQDTLKDTQVYVNTMLDFGDIWTVVDGDYPQLRVFAEVERKEPTNLNRVITGTGDITWMTRYTGEESDPYVLKDAADLYGLAKYTTGQTTEAYSFIGKYFVLADDITVNNVNTSGATNLVTWIPIGGGKKASAFKGHFDGQGHTISGIYYNNDATTATLVGLFGRVGPDATIENLNLANFDVLGYEQVGALAGYANGGTYNNIKVEDTVEVSAQRYVGGVIGWQAPNATTEFTSCHFAGTVEALVGSNGQAGGMIGYLNGDDGGAGTYLTGCMTRFDNCTVAGNIEAEGKYLAGYCGYVNYEDVEFLNCDMTGTVLSTSAIEEGVAGNGGYIGYMTNSNVAMEQCQFAGTVTSSTRKVGGFVGNMIASDLVTRYCMSSGMVDASAYEDSNPCVGGFVGHVPAGSNLDVSQSVSVATVKAASESYGTQGPIVGYSDNRETTVIYDTYTSYLGVSNQIIRNFEIVEEDAMKESAKKNMPLLAWDTVWEEVAGDIPTLKFNATAITTDDVTASEGDTNLLASNYSLTNILYQGELHAHAKTYGRGQGTYARGDDGDTPIATWKTQLTNLNLDFAASLDHNQTDHINYDDWDVSKFLYGTEAGTQIKNGIIGTGNDNDKGELHYSMIFKEQSQLEAILNNSQFGFSYSDNMFRTYPDFANKSAFDTLIKAVTDNGGFFVHVHPKVSSYSTNEDDYWFGPNTAYTGLEVLYKDTEDESQNKIYTESNYNLWKSLLNKGYRLYATAGSDTHGDLNVRALTSIYSTQAAAENKGVLIDQLQEGNFTAGPVGIQMCIENAVMGGHSVTFAEGQKLVVNIGQFQENTFDATHKYMVSVYNDQGVVYAQRLSMDAETMTPTNGTFAIPVDADSQYYRVEVYDMTENTWFAFGNPIWNGETTYQ